MSFGHSLLRERIVLIIRGSANWRKSLAKRFPDDSRNELAFRRLMKLASSKGDTDVLSAILSHPRFDLLRAAASAACRDVIFRSTPETFDDLLRQVIEKLDDDSIEFAR